MGLGGFKEDRKQAPGELPAYASRILGSIEREAPNGRRYLFEKLRVPDPKVSVHSRLRVFVACPGRSWSLLCMRLNMRSRLYALTTTNWPPETLDDVSFESGLAIRFHDTPYGHGTIARPDYFTESEWEASFDELKQRWSIRRLRRLGDNDWRELRTLFEND